jgi:hypothetical protein
MWFQRKDFSDVTIHCDNGNVLAHKSVLASSSHFFRNKFKSKDEICIEGVQKEDLELIFKFVYTGKATIRKDRMESVILLAKKLRIQGFPKTADFSFPKTESPEKLGQTEDRLSLLPPEVLIKILKDVPTQDLLLNVARVSKKFCEVIKDPVVHTRVSLPPLHRAIKFLEWASKIESLKIVTVKNKYDLYPSCHKLLHAVSSRHDLREVAIIGTKVRIGSLASLYRSGLCFRLTKLVLSVRDVEPTLEHTMDRLASAGKLKHLELTGVQSLRSKFVANLAISCSNLHTLKTDCNMTEENCFAVLEAKKRIFKHLEIEFENLKLGNGFPIPVFQSGNQVSISESFLKIKFVYSDVIYLYALTMWKDTFLPDTISLALITNDQEDKIYPVLAKACPNLTRLTLKSTSCFVDSKTIKDMVVKLDNLESVSLDFFNYCWCRFYAPALFDRSVGLKLNCLKHINLESGFYVSNQAQKMFKNIPTLVDFKFGGQLIVKDTETAEWVCRVA